MIGVRVSGSSGMRGERAGSGAVSGVSCRGARGGVIKARAGPELLTT